MRHAMTIDVEDYYQVSAMEASVARDQWEKMESRVVRNTQKILALFAEHNVQATFFVLGWVAERNPALVREIVAQKHELASHGYSHRLVYNQTPEVFREETLRGKALLEDITGVPVRGYRAASYSITPRSSWALDTLIEAGFEYDSSIFPVRHDRYGMPGTPQAPYQLIRPNGGKIVEFPLSAAHLLGYRLPAAGGGYFRLYPYWLTRLLLTSIERWQRIPFIFYLHPWEVDPDQPRIPAGKLSTFRHYNNLDVCEERLRRLLKDFSFTTVDAVLRQQGFWGANQVPEAVIA
ncbi:Polysaccharide deacetylase family protein [gamma proteobacterium HdN1]|nr:Polysaccharide deacetylase family protein [gamma proteobacterium HdN1]